MAAANYITADGTCAFDLEATIGSIRDTTTWLDIYRAAERLYTTCVLIPPGSRRRYEGQGGIYRRLGECALIFALAFSTTIHYLYELLARKPINKKM